ncbi:hypothetical protein GMORB2_1621 [Geosmithia morbida]|uniref:Inactive metallocarboxypeptidase ECM14 n=1 Tax=Geosmithia morbida TaxID=1094350 RepID=A0A9P4YSM5_9HYPO|nr:uncharacterized protein GMORB2_1621 [Geosmithia morbida]KAF4121782.1 hypothetical protein GMORB2_1621 [Geosmithia morbida]
MKANLVIVSTLLVSVVNGVGIGPHPPPVHDHHYAGSAVSDRRGGGSSSLFPFLTKVRDDVVEFIFGRHSSGDGEGAGDDDSASGGPLPIPDSIRSRYADEVVLRFNLTTAQEELALSRAADQLFLDVWAVSSDFVDIRMHKDEVGPLLSLVPESLRRSQSTLIADLAAAVYQSLPSDRVRDQQQASTAESVHADLSAHLNNGGDNLFFQDYQPLPVVVRWMRLLEAMFPSYVRYLDIGQSFQGREIPALRVGVPGAPDPLHPRKTIVITGGFHGREWISTSTVNYLAWSFITSFGKEPLITKLLEQLDIIFIPATNPDGVEYTWQVDRLWRKTRQLTGLRYCPGMDLDHTFSYEWESAHVHDDPCSERYGGERPFQAVEAMRLAQWARNHSAQAHAKFVALVDLHSYSQQVLFPFAYSCDVDPPNLENLEELAAGLAKTIRLSNGETYSVTSACRGSATGADSAESPTDSRQHLETGGGSAIDWFYHELQAHYSYQIKLRDTGSYGFLLPKEHIVPTGEEIFDAMKYFGDYLLGNNGIERFSDEDEDEHVTAKDDSSPFSNDDETELLDSMELRRRRVRR